mmetsp:Transcript_62266/g.135243  ORF Transcript_62266/g.135243 Transcript_62266/m.135243 type:complete len:212 (+) Transcript_62266:355-990(+)
MQRQRNSSDKQPDAAERSVLRWSLLLFVSNWHLLSGREETRTPCLKILVGFELSSPRRSPPPMPPQPRSSPTLPCPPPRGARDNALCRFCCKVLSSGEEPTLPSNSLLPSATSPTYNDVRTTSRALRAAYRRRAQSSNDKTILQAWRLCRRVRPDSSPTSARWSKPTPSTRKPSRTSRKTRTGMSCRFWRCTSDTCASLVIPPMPKCMRRD